VLGTVASQNVVHGSFNAAIGYQAGPSSDFSHAAALGALSAPSQNGDVRLGDNSFTTRIGGFQPYTNLSDARFKINVRDNVPGLEFVKRLRPVTYNWDMAKLAEFDGQAQSTSAIGEELRAQNSKKVNTGFLAQQVEAAASEVGYDFSGVSKPLSDKATYGLAYAEFVVPLVKAAQEQQAEIEQLQAALKVAQLDRSEPTQHSNMLPDNPTSLGVLGCLVGLLLAKRRKESGGS
jgi:hypothetical protein